MTLNLKPVWPVCPFTYQAASSACWPCSAGKGQSATHGLSVSPVAADRAGRVGNVCHSPADGPSLQCWPDQQWSLVLQTEPGTTSPVGFLPQSWDTGPEHPGRPVWKCAAGTRLIWCIWLHCQFKKKKKTLMKLACNMLSPVTRPSVQRVWIRVLACSLSSSERSSEQTMILFSISDKKCLGAFISFTALTASLTFLLFR